MKYLILNHVIKGSGPWINIKMLWKNVLKKTGSSPSSMLYMLNCFLMEPKFCLYFISFFDIERCHEFFPEGSQECGYLIVCITVADDLWIQGAVKTIPWSVWKRSHKILHLRFLCNNHADCCHWWSYAALSVWSADVFPGKWTQPDSRAPSQYKDRLIYVWRFPC